MDKEYAIFLLEKTKKDYNFLAENYDRTRSFISEDIKKLAELVQAKEKILDSGCANGRLYEILKEKKIDYYGIDISENLIKIAQNKYPEAKFQVANALNLPFQDNFFDKVFSISVLHNIPSKEFKIQYLQEIKRVLKPNGFLILRVWDFWKRREGWQIFLKYTLLKLIGKSKLDFFDIFLPWKNSNGNILVQRYFHCFKKKGIEKLIKEVGFKIKKSWREGKDPRTNIYVVAEKLL